MFDSKTIITGVVALVVCSGVAYFFLSSVTSPNTTESTQGSETSTQEEQQIDNRVGAVPASVALKKNVIQIHSPVPNQVVGKEFEVTGIARGYWYSEASFPVVVLDSTGYAVAEGVALAQSSWMTTEFVPYLAKIKVMSEPKSDTGILRLKKDDPSGEKPESIEIPIRFK